MFQQSQDDFDVISYDFDGSDLKKGGQVCAGLKEKFSSLLKDSALSF